MSGGAHCLGGTVVVWAPATLGSRAAPAIVRGRRARGNLRTLCPLPGVGVLVRLRDGLPGWDRMPRVGEGSRRRRAIDSVEGGHVERGRRRNHRWRRDRARRGRRPRPLSVQPRPRGLPAATTRPAHWVTRSRDYRDPDAHWLSRPHRFKLYLTDRRWHFPPSRATEGEAGVGGRRYQRDRRRLRLVESSWSLAVQRPLFSGYAPPAGDTRL
jgi:hypothetical protein